MNEVYSPDQPPTGEVSLDRLSVLIPAKNEALCINRTVHKVSRTLRASGIPFEIIVVNDNSTDGTSQVLKELSNANPELTVLSNTFPSGFGNAVKFGLNHIAGDAVIIMMADESDCVNDLIVYWRELQSGWDCVFGSRFIKGGSAKDYPLIKLVLNRLGNKLIQALFSLNYNDTTNAFKAYRTQVIRGTAPIISNNFNITVELPINAILAGYNWTVVPTAWRNRKSGKSKFKIRDMGTEYLMTIAYLWIKRKLMKGHNAVRR